VYTKLQKVVNFNFEVSSQKGKIGVSFQAHPEPHPEIGVSFNAHPEIGVTFIAHPEIGELIPKSG